MAMGLKRAMDRIRRKMKRKNRLLLASLVILFAIVGILTGKVNAEEINREANPQFRNFCPTCTEVAYVGLDDNDYLTLYDGPPKSGEIVLKLFKLDIEAIENSLPEETLDQLMNGIQVSDEAEYSSVLSSFSDYAVGGQ